MLTHEMYKYSLLYLECTALMYILKEIKHIFLPLLVLYVFNLLKDFKTLKGIKLVECL